MSEKKKPTKPATSSPPPAIVTPPPPPFSISLDQLTLLVHPNKNKVLLQSLNGVQGLCEKLNVNPSTGLSFPTSTNVNTTASPSSSSSSKSKPVSTISSSNALPTTSQDHLISHTSSSSSSSSSSSIALAPTTPSKETPPSDPIPSTTSPTAVVHFDSIEQSDHDLIQHINLRKEYYGINVLPPEKPKTFLQIVWLALHDKMLIVLMIAAVIMLSAGLYFRFSSTKNGEPKSEEDKNKWIEGVAILIVILVVVLVASGNDYKKEQQFRILNQQKEARNVTVLRNGQKTSISVFDLLVGDVLLLQPGDILSTDGVVIESHGLECDESSATGESDAIKKGHDKDKDPFVLSGSKVIEGTGACVVTGVGVHSFHGKTMMSLRTEMQETPLQEKLNDLAEVIAKLGAIFAIFMFVSLLIRYCISESVSSGKFRANPVDGLEIFFDILRIVITSIAIVVVAVPEGLPLAVTLALSFATQKMLKENNLVRVLASCEVMANATTVCSDKTGTLTQNKMTVVKAQFGLNTTFSNVNDLTQLRQRLNESMELFELIQEGIAVNSSAFEEIGDDHVPRFVGSKTETALLDMQRKCGVDYSTYRARCSIHHMYPFSSATKYMGSIHRLPTSNATDSSSLFTSVPNAKYRFHVKGASEVILHHSTYIYDSNLNQLQSMSSQHREVYEKCIETFAKASLRTIGLAFRDFTELPDQYEQQPPLGHLVFLGLVGIEDPLREGVVEAVASCQKAGVFVRMVTGDNIMTARAIATQAGIYQPGGIVLEGPQFRKLSDEEMEKMLPRLQVLARSSPLDKQLLVKKLKSMGEVVAVTGDGTNDAPALKLADVGFSMGIAGTEVAKEASSIVLMDDNFSSIVRALIWGRSVNDSVKKFLQFQLTVNVCAVIVTYLTSLIPKPGVHEEGGLLTVVQLLWVNMIMDSLAALAYATEPPQEDILLSRHPEPKTSPLINLGMWKMVFGQALFQCIVILSLHYAMPNQFFSSLSHLPASLTPDELKYEVYKIEKTFLFNMFIFFQLSNQINCRSLTEHSKPVVQGLFSNIYFIGILLSIIVIQVLLVQFAGAVFNTTPLSIELWCISIAIGLISLPLGVFLRSCVPNTWLSKLSWLQRFLPHQRVFMTKERLQWHSAIHKVQTQLAVFRALRGDRVIASYHSMHSSTSSFRQGQYQTQEWIQAATKASQSPLLEPSSSSSVVALDTNANTNTNTTTTLS